jgi:enoyl-CoA hydratase/carnithine racemase
MSNAEPYVLRQDHNGVATLLLNRPGQFNALSAEMMSALQAELTAVGRDHAVQVVVLAGAGKAFCAGHDLKQMLGMGGEEQPQQAYQDLFGQCAKLMLQIQQLRQPVIARVHGVATAAGCQLVAMCDMAVASNSARFAVSGINVGLFCATPAVALSRNIGRKAALEMLLTGEFTDAATALARGLVNRVTEPEQLDAEIAKLCAAIQSKPAGVIANGKDLFYRQLEMGIAGAYQLAGHSMACNMADPVAQEGVTAFVEKRAPNWHKAD